MYRRSMVNGLVVGLIASVALTACANDPAGQTPAASADKAGVNPAPITLRLGTADDESRPGAEQIRRFAAHVQELSDGTMTIEPVWSANGDDQQGGWDQVVARMVTSGSLDMAMIPARAWDTEGVTSLRALHAPFLVTSDELLTETVTGGLAAELLAGLDAVGVRGIALAPESLRHLFVVGDPPETLDDLAGRLVRSPRSDTTWALFKALGARADDLTDPGESDAAAQAAGEIGAYESSFALAGSIPGGLTAIGNVPLFPKVNTLVVNAAADERLTDDQRRILDQAAAQMVAEAIETLPDTATYAEQYCRNGGAIVDANDDTVAAMRRAVEPVYSDLSADGPTLELITKIRDVAERIGSAPPDVAACATTASEASPPTQGSSEFPEGDYRAEVTVESLTSAGVDTLTAYNHSGTFTLTFRDGMFVARDAQYVEPGCPGSTYATESGRVTITMGPAGPTCGDARGRVLFSAAWTAEGDELTFHDVKSVAFELLMETLFGRTWTKIN